MRYCSQAHQSLVHVSQNDDQLPFQLTKADWEPYGSSTSDQPASTPDSSSSSLEEYHSYSRRVLPQLLEAHLTARITQRLVPIEEELKTIVGETVRSCQLIMHENYQRLHRPSDSSTSMLAPTVTPRLEQGIDVGAIDQLSRSMPRNKNATDLKIRPAERGTSDSGYGSGEPETSQAEDSISLDTWPPECLFSSSTPPRKDMSQSIGRNTLHLANEAEGTPPKISESSSWEDVFNFDSENLSSSFLDPKLCSARP